MVIEHTFVTTMEAPQAMTAAAQFLAQRGFVDAAGHGFAVDNEADWNSLEMRRGKKSAVRAKSIAQLPQPRDECRHTPSLRPHRLPGLIQTP